MPSKNILGIKLVVNLQSNYPNHNYGPEELLLLIVTDYFCYGQIHATQTYPGRARSALYRLRDVLPHSVERAVPGVSASSEVEEEMQVLLCDFCALETDRLSDVFSRTLGRRKGRPGAVSGKPRVALFAGEVEFAVT